MQPARIKLHAKEHTNSPVQRRGSSVNLTDKLYLQSWCVLSGGTVVLNGVSSFDVLFPALTSASAKAVLGRGGGGSVEVCLAFSPRFFLSHPFALHSVSQLLRLDAQKYTFKPRRQLDSTRYPGIADGYNWAMSLNSSEVR